MNKNNHLRALCESSVFLALAVALGFVKVWQMPLGGAVTLASMLPICLISIKYGIGWGLGAAFCFSWFQVLSGGVFSWGLTPTMLAASIVLDYLAAFTLLGFAGVFRKKGLTGCLLGIGLVCVLRFLVHFLSGVILWANLDEFVVFGKEWFNKPVLYSICYNGAFMLPETVFTLLVAFLLLRVPTTRRFLIGR